MDDTFSGVVPFYASLRLALTELAEAQEADKTEVQSALAEIAELIAGRGEDIC